MEIGPSSEMRTGESRASAHDYETLSDRPSMDNERDKEKQRKTAVDQEVDRSGNGDLCQGKLIASSDNERKKQSNVKRQKKFSLEDGQEYLFKCKKLMTKQTNFKANDKPLNALYLQNGLINYKDNSNEVLINKENLPVNSCSSSECNYENPNRDGKDTQCLKKISEIESEFGYTNTENIEGKNNKMEITPTENTVFIPEPLSSNSTFGNDDDEQVIDIPNFLSNTQHPMKTKHSGEISKFELKRKPNNMDPQFISDVKMAESIYMKQSNKSFVHAFEQSQQLFSTSDLTLIQLVLSLKQDIQKLTKKVEIQESILNTVVRANEINLTPLFAQTFCEKYGLNLPFSKIAEFDKFNQDLSRNAIFCNEFITSLCSYIDNNVTLAKNILTMLRTYMSKDLVVLYTASKTTGNKMVLKDTLFCKCLLQVTKLTIRNGLLPLEHEKAFMKNLSLVVSGAKSWHNRDKERKNNT